MRGSCMQEANWCQLGERAMKP
eukprot:Gb_04594 [translate_table: standard]